MERRVHPGSHSAACPPPLTRLFDLSPRRWNSYAFTLSPSRTASSSSSSLPPATLYFSGDTGYSPSYYPLLGSSLPRAPDLALLPIGSYRPTWHMSPQHCSPFGAVSIARDIRARKVVGMHWGTWIMSDEEWDEPPTLLEEALRLLEEQGVKEAREWFTTVNLGQTNHLAITEEK